MKNLTRFLLLLAYVSLLLIVSCDKEESNPTTIENNQNGDDNGDQNGDDEGKDNGDNNGNIVFNPDISYGTVTDIDGNSYKTVVIGNQTWMAENLKVTKYNDGTAIPHLSDLEWYDVATLFIGTYKNYTPDSIVNEEYLATYGRLYNWYAVNTGNLCPDGWHVPSDKEWDELVGYLTTNDYGPGGGRGVAKALASSSGWNSSQKNGTIGNNDYPELQNASGFTALPGGYFVMTGGLSEFGKHGYWWSATEYLARSAFFRNIRHDNSIVLSPRYNYNKTEYYSVRCVKD